MVRAVADVERALLEKGMAVEVSHHRMYRKTIDGVTQLVTRVSHGSTEIGDTLAKLMANQLCLQLKEFWSLVECPLSEDEWDAIVKQRCPDGRNPFLRR